MIRAIVGANWGDEGKGKMTDLFAGEADMVVRYQGGANAGHTIINDKGRFALHQLPSGVFSPNVINIMANGVALDVEKLVQEIRTLTDAGIEFNLCVSDRAQILLPHHVLLDEYEEERLGERQFGSTKSGIAPFFSDKYAKVGVPVWQLYEDDTLNERIADLCKKVNVTFEKLYGKPPIETARYIEAIYSAAIALRPYITDTAKMIREGVQDGKNILLEGQLGALRDPDHGIYPYTTSSSTLAGYASVGAGISPRAIDEIVVVTKAYSSSVGAGPFVVELDGDEAEELRKRGGDRGEYGATTGRPRRVGFFDAVATRYGCDIQGATDVAMTNIDVLGYLDEIPVCVAYEIGGVPTTQFPSTAMQEKAVPVFEYLPGWKCDIRGETDYAKLPENARRYIETIEGMLPAPIKYVSTGPEREAIIYR